MNQSKVPKTKPVIRQTKASLYRLARNNPFLLQDNKLQNVLIPEAVTGMTKIERATKPIEIAPIIPSRTNNTCDKSVLKTTNVLPAKQIVKTTNVLPAKQTAEVRPKNGFIKNNIGVGKKCGVNYAQRSLKDKQPSNLKKKENHVVNMQKPRRSLSAQYFENKKHVPVLEPEKVAMKAEVTQSMENIADESIIPPERKAVKFATPNRVHAYRDNNRRSTVRFPVHSTPVNNGDLQRRLNDWLKKRGKSLSTFHHLKCFGVHKQAVPLEDVISREENKENIEENAPLVRSESYESLHIDRKNTEKQEDTLIRPGDMKSVAVDALTDLNKLILEGYPMDQCEDWVAAIRRKYANIEEEPQYWECRASIERSRGNITCAVHCLTTALTKGAEVQHVDESLDQLFQKFSMLDINTPTSKEFDDREKKILNKKCNIFKSTLIQFAVRDKELKKKKQDEESTKAKKLVATPVRRSTRLSRSGYISTPRMKICDSLNDLEESLKKDICFKTNQYIK